MTTIRWFAAALFVTLGHSTAFAASGRITGTVFAVDGSRVSGATVTVEGSSRSARTDGDGDYRIDGVPAGVRLVLVVIHPGFEAADAAATVEPNASAVVDFRLKLARLQERIEIRGEIPLLGASEGVSRLTLAPSQIESLPSLGERDIFRAMQLLPGVSGSNETSSGLYVRGGTPDQNLVSYDGFTIYHVDHLFGYFTAFNMEAVDEVELHKGAYDARFGGRLSSVLELRGKAGSKDRYTGSITASMLSAGGAFSAPLGEKGSVLLAGRRSFQSGLYNDILGMFGSETGGGGPRMIGGGPAGGAPSGGGAGFVPQGGMLGQYQTTPKSYFYDLNAKAVYSLGPKDRVELSLFGGADNLDNSRSMEIPSFQPRFGSSTEAPAFTISGTIDTTDEGRWANRAGSLGWTRRWTPGSETRLSVGFSRFTNVRDRSSNSNVTITGDTGDASDMPFQPRGGSGMGSVEDNTLDDLTIRLQHRVSLGSSHRLELGAQVTTNDVAYQFDTELPGFSEDDDDISNAYRPSQLSELLDRDEKGRLIAGYVQDTVSLPGRVTLIPGLRVVNYDRTGETWLEPRVSLTAAVSDNWKLKGAFGQYRQVVNRITREDQAQGDREFWTLADGDIVPVARSSQAVAGVSYEAGSLLVDLEFFRKPMSDLTEYAPRLRPGQLPGESRESFYVGTGLARGFDVLVQRRFGKNTGWVAYTYGKVELDFPTLEPESFPATHDQTHEVKFVDSMKIGNWTAAATWIYATGKPYTAPTGIEAVEVANGRTFDFVTFGPKNGGRLPAYHRLDLALNYAFTLAGGQARAGVTVFNLYDRKNVWYREFQGFQGEMVSTDVSLMGRAVNLFVSLRF